MPALFDPIILEILVLSLGLVLLLAEAFSKAENKSWMAHLSIYVLGIIFAWSFFTKGDFAPEALRTLSYTADSTALFFKRIALLTTMIVLVMSIEYRGILARFLPVGAPGAGTGEFYILPIFTCAGLMFMASAIDFLFIFVALELVTISFYVLVAYMRRNTASLEAGVKYLILGALSTGFLVYGFTWLFGLTGETNLLKIGDTLPTLLAEGGRLHGSETGLLFGLMLVLVGLGFKVAAAPFQIWVPDVYQGAPTPITAFLSVGSKAAGFIVLLRVLQPFLSVPALNERIIAVLVIIAIASLIYGNLAAMPQDNLKRMLAYSSIAHAGYLLVAVASIGPARGSFGSSGVAVAFYLAGYLIMTLLSFLIMLVVAKHSRGDDIIHFNGLAKRSPFLAFAMLAAILSLAGVPFTVGFIGKWLVFAAAVQQHQFVLVGVGVITVAAGFYYYLRVIAAMYWQEPNDDTPIRANFLSKATIA
ncbi:MAG: NADH-quinone oxidoreductase subunit N, partial [Chthoniobacteraceae bacterium]